MVATAKSNIVTTNNICVCLKLFKNETTSCFIGKKPLLLINQAKTHIETCIERGKEGIHQATTMLIKNPNRLASTPLPPL
ncbi:MAG: hypothetical protein IIV19_06170 [Bacteroidaceae bacterium]|nr:hypothetical protein [Bacteroidaceae bacterium]